MGSGADIGADELTNDGKLDAAKMSKMSPASRSPCPRTYQSLINNKRKSYLRIILLAKESGSD